MAITTIWVLVLLATLYFSSALSALHNVTIDDYYGDPVTGEQFSYSDSWVVGPQCNECLVAPDPSQLYNGTWHDTNEPGMSASVMFPGTAIWVYGVLAFAGSDEATLSTALNVTFLIDGQRTAGISTDSNESGGADSTYSYNFLLFNQGSLSDELHNFTLLNGMNSLVILDYLIYTSSASIDPSSIFMSSSALSSALSSTPSPTPTPSGPNGSSPSASSIEPAESSAAAATASSELSKQTVVIVATVTSIGCLLIITVIGALCYWRKRRWRGNTVRRLALTPSVESFHDNYAPDTAVLPPPAYEDLVPSTFSPGPSAITRSNEAHSTPVGPNTRIGVLELPRDLAYPLMATNTDDYTRDGAIKTTNVRSGVYDSTHPAAIAFAPSVVSRSKEAAYSHLTGSNR
ncbi:hypothetical protein CERSUDRAFT_116622 [Gelatoporia subvermispora B]|uniref:Uncharacterized protein n=1 Tax=Ceriporiopsis subvermispora (strain B) TaxID=914234 RepID=M2QDM8_CERS8|nr:hypothetical protein CERSUDRAFT_116622 [Gelatoporia subvermispora B]